MDTRNQSPEPGSLDEFYYAEKAAFEKKETGTTDKRCLRCGGNYQLYEAGNSYEITCDGCNFKETVRGI